MMLPGKGAALGGLSAAAEAAPAFASLSSSRAAVSAPRAAIPNLTIAPMPPRATCRINAGGIKLQAIDFLQLHSVLTLSL
jgi:hypothetical protein